MTLSIGDNQRVPQRAPAKERDPVMVVGGLAAGAAAVVTLLPIPIVVLVALSKSWRAGPGAGMTLEWITGAWQRMDGAILISARVAAFVLVIDLLLALPAAWLIARYDFPGRSLLRALSTLPIAIPGIAVGLGLILAFPHLRPTGWLMVVGHVLYTLPFLLGALIPALANRSLVQQEQVALSLGAGFVRRFRTITLPGIRAALIAGVLMVVTLSLGEFNVSFFIFTPLQQPLPVSLYDGYLTGRLESAAGATVLFLAMVVPAAVALERLGGARVTSA